MKPIPGKAEPRFDIDYEYGREAELQVKELLDHTASGKGKVEVKRKRYLDLFFYVETSCDKGRRDEYQPSGIFVTTAHTWVFVIADTGLKVVFPTALLRSMLDDPSSRDAEETDGSCPTKGKLVSLVALLYRSKQRGQHPKVSSQDPLAPAVILYPVTDGTVTAKEPPRKTATYRVPPHEVLQKRAESAAQMSDDTLAANIDLVCDQDSEDGRVWLEILQAEQQRRRTASA